MVMEESDSDPCETEPLVHPQSDTGARPKTKTLTLKPPNVTLVNKKERTKKHRQEETATNKSRKDTHPRALLGVFPEEKNGDYKKEVLNETAEEYQEEDKESVSMLCPIFGVRNYLNHFYEKTEVQNSSMYEEMPTLTEDRETIFLVKRKEGLCSSSVFRLSLMLGCLILLLGTIAFVVAACASRRATLVGKVGGIAVVDRVAASHNAEVDALLLVGLVALTLGATVIASALISRAFCKRPEEQEEPYREDLVNGYASIYDYPPFLKSVDKKVPATEDVTSIQPWISSSHCVLQDSKN